MKYLVDANVLSEATRPSPSSQVIHWLRSNEGELAITPVVLGELEYGILIRSEGRDRRRLKVWFSSRIQNLKTLDIDANTASVWARLLARLKQGGTPIPIKDSLIAASALQHGLAVATRNVKDFVPAGVDIVNPFEVPEAL